jgi:hypothetical protein
MLGACRVIDTPEYQEKLRQLEILEARLESRGKEKISLARRNFTHFCEAVLRDEFSGQKVELAALHKSWIQHIHTCWERGLHAAVLAPWGSGKTSLIAVALPLFALGVQPSLRIKLISASDDTARERVALIRRYIEDSEELKEIFPHLRPSEHQDWTRTKLFIQRPVRAKDASIEAKGILSSAMGGRADLLCIDDVSDARNCLWQPRLRNVVWSNFCGTFLSRLEPRGKVSLIACCVAGTPVLRANGTTVSIEDIRPGDMVMSWTGMAFVPRRVRGVIQQGDSPTVTVCTIRHAIQCTPDHPILRADGVWVPAGQLQAGDAVRTMRAVECNTFEEATVPSRLFLWLLGFLFGDGWVTRHIRPRQYGSMSYATCVASGNKPIVLRAVLRAFVAVFGVRLYRTRFGYHRTDVYRVGRILGLLGLTGKARTKRLPDWLFGISTEHQRAFLRGFVLADGWYARRDAQGADVYGLKLANRDLVVDIRNLALQCGVRPTRPNHIIRYTQPPNSRRRLRAETWHLWLTFENDTAASRTDRVRYVTKNALVQPVFDLSVEGEGNFVADGIVIHNTRWHVADVVGRILADPDMQRGWGFLTQRISDDFKNIDCEYIYGRPEGAKPHSRGEQLLRLFDMGILSSNE